MKCTCGSNSVGGGKHSDYCDLLKVVEKQNFTLGTFFALKPEPTLIELNKVFGHIPGYSKSVDFYMALGDTLTLSFSCAPENLHLYEKAWQESSYIKNEILGPNEPVRAEPYTPREIEDYHDQDYCPECGRSCGCWDDDDEDEYDY